MKKLIILLLFIPIVSFGQVKNGVIKSYYENDNIKTIYNYNNGELDGAQYEYYENGKLKVSSEYIDGLTILYESYDINGKLTSVFELQEVGSTITEYSDGGIIIKSFFDNNYKIIKKFVTRNNTRVANYIHKNGNKNDYDLILFDENDKMSKTVSYVNNVKDGFESFWRDGKVYMRKFYVNGFETEIKSGNKPCYIEKNGMKYIEDEDGTLTLAPFNVTEKCE